MCRDLKRESRLGRHRLGAQRIDAAVSRLRALLDSGMAGACQRFDGRLQVLNIGGQQLVDDHEIDRQVAQRQVLVRAHQFTHKPNLAKIIDLEHHDRPITRYAVCPERVGACAIAAEYIAARPQRGIEIKQMRRKALKETGLFRIEAKMVQLHARLRPGQRRGAIVGRCVSALVDDLQHLLARFGDGGPERHPRGGARCN